MRKMEIRDSAIGPPDGRGPSEHLYLRAQHFNARQVRAQVCQHRKRNQSNLVAAARESSEQALTQRANRKRPAAVSVMAALSVMAVRVAGVQVRAAVCGAVVCVQ